MSADVAIVICTRCRADGLRETLASIAKCMVPDGLRTELLVVDNGSTDDTRAVAETCAIVNMPVRYAFEPRKGKGYAYNTGIAEADGQVLLFTDDDVRVPTSWIEDMCGPILNGEADAVAGGVVFPKAQEQRLASEPFASRRGWFADTFNINREKPDRMVGANMAFGRHTLEAVPGFDERLGPGALGFYDETLFAWQLLDAGFRIVPRLDVAVVHDFDLSRLTRKGLLSLAARMGASEGYMAWHWHHKGRPTEKIRRDAKRGLLMRRMLHPWCWVSNTAPDWELTRVLASSFYEQLWQESFGPRRYSPVKDRTRGVGATIS